MVPMKLSSAIPASTQSVTASMPVSRITLQHPPHTHRAATSNRKLELAAPYLYWVRVRVRVRKLELAGTIHLCWCGTSYLPPKTEAL
jgi:hypothetical protein